eukprot:GHVU01031612.1.p1 GENE.GHVU01031612.1~~GHVU01031612.1.p1  ORF type:complete len:636 (+),score=66.52 GHVU01031612.1:376-2283(+)
MFYRTKRRPHWVKFLVGEEGIEKCRRLRPYGLPLVVLLTIIIIYCIPASSISQPFRTAGRSTSRRLLEGNDSLSHLPSWEQCYFERDHVPGAWVFSHALCILIIFIAIAIICDDFFVPSLEVISERLNLSEDVAGATFMAGGSSAPELFTSVAGVIVETDVGVGTIVGSAVFNILIIIALTAALAGQVLHLDWRPLCRDSFFYAMSIGCFIGFAWDGWFQHYEAVTLLCLYILYIVLMVFNTRLMDWMGTWRCCFLKPSVLPIDESPENGEAAPEEPHTEGKDGSVNANGVANGPHRLSLNGPGGHARRLSVISQRSTDDGHIFHHKQRGSIFGALAMGATPKKSSLAPGDDALKETKIVEEEEEEEGSKKDTDSHKSIEEPEEEEDDDNLQLCPCLPCCPAVRSSPPSTEDVKEKGGCMNWFKLILRWIIFIPAFPFVVLFSWTIPDCSREEYKKYYIVSFIVSVSWIAGLSFGMVTLVGRVGCILDVDSYTMGLVIIAVGTSVPDALSSVLVARDGYGDMAVSNAIGSNVFDINLGLGLPFLIRIAIDAGKPISLLDSTEWVYYMNGTMPIVQHAKFGFILLLILFITLIIFIAVRFRLNKWIGISFVCLYIMFLTYCFTQELYCIRTAGIYC